MAHPTHERARMEILWHVCQDMLHWKFEGSSGSYNSRDYFIEPNERDGVPIGSLVTVTSTIRAHKWYLGWLREIIRQPHGYHTYVIESIEDGEVCNWSNVGIRYVSPKTLTENPRWQWSDKQFHFNSRWLSIKKQFTGTFLQPTNVLFHSDGSLTLRLRKQFEAEIIISEPFKNMRAVTRANMVEFYSKCVEEDQEREKASAARI